MKFICGACKTKYTISDDKVRGKVLKVKCKKCEAVVEVREAAAGAEAVARVVAPGAGAGDGGHAPAPAPAEPRARIPTAPPVPSAAAPAPRPRTATGGLPFGGAGAGLSPGAAPRPRTATSPPPPPPDALRPGGPGQPLRAGPGVPAPRPAPKPSTGTAFPAARASTDPRSSGLRPAVRPGGFLASGGNGGAAGGGLASSLAEALSTSVAPTASKHAEPEARSSYVDGLVSKASPKEWWAAIRDTPTGPMTREEIDDHIKVGDVDAESLVWREGQDDWRPLRDVHALSELLRGTGRAQLPKPPPGRAPLQAGSAATPLPLAPDRSIGSVATPIAAKGAVAVPAPAVLAGPRVSSAPGSMFPASSGLPITPGSGSLQIPIDDIAHEAPVPIATPARGIDDYPRVPVHGDSVVPSSRKMGPLAWVAVCGALAFGVTLALGLLQYLGPRLGNNPTTAPTERVRVVTVGGALPDLAPAGSGANVPPGQQGGEDPTTPGGRQGGPRPAGAGNGANQGKTKALSAEDAALLARFQQQNGMPAGGNLDPSQLHRPAGQNGSGGGSALTADQVRAVVSGQRGSVQSCYERAMRGRAQAEDVRVTVVANVGPSGTVTNVTVRGGQDPTMTACIQAAVRRWRFPAAAGASQPEIPFLFTAHATQ